MPKVHRLVFWLLLFSSEIFWFASPIYANPTEVQIQNEAQELANSPEVLDTVGCQNPSWISLCQEYLRDHAVEGLVRGAAVGAGAALLYLMESATVHGDISLANSILEFFTASVTTAENHVKNARWMFLIFGTGSFGFQVMNVPYSAYISFSKAEESLKSNPLFRRKWAALLGLLERNVRTYGAEFTYLTLVNSMITVFTGQAMPSALKIVADASMATVEQGWMEQSLAEQSDRAKKTHPQYSRAIQKIYAKFTAIFAVVSTWAFIAHMYATNEFDTWVWPYSIPAFVIMGASVGNYFYFLRFQKNWNFEPQVPNESKTKLSKRNLLPQEPLNCAAAFALIHSPRPTEQ